jgi:hypothetical protein
MPYLFLKITLTKLTYIFGNFLEREERYERVERNKLADKTYIGLASYLGTYGCNCNDFFSQKCCKK